MKDSSLGRLLSVLLWPVETFSSVEARPTWVAPLLLFMVLAGSMSYLIQVKIDPEEAVRTQFSKMKIEVSDEQMDKAIRDAENRTNGTKAALAVGGAAFQAGIVALVAALFLGGLRLFASEIDYRRAFSATLYGYAPQALAGIINLPILLGRETVTFDEASQGGVLVSSLAALASEDTSAMLKTLLGSVDLFTIWTVVLLAVGFRVVGKVSTAVSAGIVILLWLIYIGGKLGLTALFIR
ncbi:MAG: YIP1 family protein [Acidobacteriota bacterium]